MHVFQLLINKAIKALHKRERDSLKGPHEEAEIRHKALRRRKNVVSLCYLAHLAPSANAALPSLPLLQTSYPPSAHFVFSPSVPLPQPHTPACFSTPPASSSPLTTPGFFTRMLKVSKLGALNFKLYLVLSC